MAKINLITISSSIKWEVYKIKDILPLDIDLYQRFESKSLV